MQKGTVVCNYKGDSEDVLKASWYKNKLQVTQKIYSNILQCDP